MGVYGYRRGRDIRSVTACRKSPPLSENRSWRLNSQTLFFPDVSSPKVPPVSGTLTRSPSRRHGSRRLFLPSYSDHEPLHLIPYWVSSGSHLPDFYWTAPNSSLTLPSRCHGPMSVPPFHRYPPSSFHYPEPPVKIPHPDRNISSPSLVFSPY